MSEPDKPLEINYSARVQKKLQMASESSEPIFDLSDCNLTSVPNNVFSLCKVLRKEAFYLQKNCLTSLSNGGDLFNLRNLILLDLNTNNFSKLPDNIDALENLQVLNVSKNQLTELPVGIGNLQKLVELDVSFNKLKRLPDSIGNCKNMEILNVSRNEPLKELPKTLGRLRNLEEIILDQTISYPPAEICNGGVKNILSFFQRELTDYPIPSTSAKFNQQVDLGDMLQEQLRRQEELKLNKQKELLELEKSLAKQKEEEVRLQEKSKEQKARILKSIKSRDNLLNAELSKIQEKKDQERAALISQIQEEEKKSDEVVKKILNLKKLQKLNDLILYEIEKKDEERYVNSLGKSFKVTTQSSAEMEALMKEDIRKAQDSIAQRRSKILNSLCSEIVLQQEELYNFLKKRNMNSTQLVEAIRKNEDLQKIAVTSLLEKSDAASWELAKQISVVQTQLAELTKIELKKRKLETDIHIAQLNQNRLALTDILVELFNEQDRRRKILIEKLENLEELKKSYIGPNSFWIDQYNKLFESKGHQIVKFLESVDQRLVFDLFLNGVFHYLPLLKDVALNEKALENLNAETLNELGIKNQDDVKKILEAVESYLKHKYSHKAEPSAPLLAKPSAPMERCQYSELEECVICLDRKPEVVFLPCGHICSCFRCISSISLCPLCRKPIDETRELVGLS